MASTSNAHWRFAAEARNMQWGRSMRRMSAIFWLGLAVLVADALAMLVIGLRGLWTHTTAQGPALITLAGVAVVVGAALVLAGQRWPR